MPSKKPNSNKTKTTKPEVKQEPIKSTLPEIKAEEPKEEQPQQKEYFKLYQVGFADYNYYVPAINERAAEESLREREPSMRPLPISAVEITIEGYKILCEKVE